MISVLPLSKLKMVIVSGVFEKLIFKDSSSSDLEAQESKGNHVANIAHTGRI